MIFRFQFLAAWTIGFVLHCIPQNCTPQDLSPDKPKHGSALPHLFAESKRPQNEPAVAAEKFRAEPNPFVGVWRTTSASITIILSIRPDGRGLFVLIDGGSNSCEQVTWKVSPGGILVESLPRFRFWKGRHANEVRAEMEPLPPELTSRNVGQFHRTFFMRRNGQRKYPPALKNRPLPAGWNQSALPDDWDNKAGRRVSPVPEQP